MIEILSRYYHKYRVLKIEMKHPRGAYGLVGLFVVLLVAVSVLPWIRRTFARSFPEGFTDSRPVDCKGVTCKEGEFCQENVCRSRSIVYNNDYYGNKDA